MSQQCAALSCVTLSKLHAAEDIMHMLVRVRLYAQGIGITALMLHAHAKQPRQESTKISTSGRHESAREWDISQTQSCT